MSLHRKFHQFASLQMALRQLAKGERDAEDGGGGEEKFDDLGFVFGEKLAQLSLK